MTKNVLSSERGVNPAKGTEAAPGRPRSRALVVGFTAAATSAAAWAVVVAVSGVSLEVLPAVGIGLAAALIAFGVGYEISTRTSGRQVAPAVATAGPMLTPMHLDSSRGSGPAATPPPAPAVPAQRPQGPLMMPAEAPVLAPEDAWVPPTAEASAATRVVPLPHRETPPNE